MWNEQDNKLVKEFKFPDFKEALGFVNAIGELAENMNHHPDLELGWGRVKVSLATHSAGKITDKDRELAAGIEALQKI